MCAITSSKAIEGKKIAAKLSSVLSVENRMYPPGLEERGCQLKELDLVVHTTHVDQGWGWAELSGVRR